MGCPAESQKLSTVFWGASEGGGKISRGKLRRIPEGSGRFRQFPQGSIWFYCALWVSIGFRVFPLVSIMFYIVPWVSAEAETLV